MNGPPPAPVFEPLGDSAILVTLGREVDRELSRAVQACASATEEARMAGVTDIVPAYASLAIHYDARTTSADEMLDSLRVIVGRALQSGYPVEPGELITIPVRYDGPDLDAVAAATSLSVDAAIAAHSSVEYFAYMLGFTPGFAYLGDLDPALRIPRRESPRTRVPAGAVAIAGAQTAVYPHETPGGWHLIGRTSLRMFDASRARPALVRPGDRVRFEPVQ
jgi:KipI family sensor histidine kinase inhibitor